MLLSFCQWVDTTWIAAIERDTTWGFAITSIFHLFGLILQFGSISVMSLRLFGLCMKNRSMSQVANGLWRWNLLGLALSLTSGALMFTARATTMYDNGPFWIKMSFLFTALIFHFSLYRYVIHRDDVGPALRAVTAFFAVVLWLGVGVGGRAIGFF
jgi:hypothetical protein